MPPKKQVVRLERRPESATENPSLEYEDVPAAPGLRMFVCTTWRAKLSTRGCADRWIEAQTAISHRAEELAPCRGCPLGAGHAGHAFVALSAVFGKPICARCGGGGMRIVGGRLCVSCYNRRRELKLGVNGRGNVPVELMQRPLVAVEVIVEVDGEVRRIQDPETSGLLESMIQILRTVRGEICFPVAPGCLPEDVSPLLLKALAPHLREVTDPCAADVNGPDTAPPTQIPRACDPRRSGLLRTTAFTVFRSSAAPISLAA